MIRALLLYQLESDPWQTIGVLLLQFHFPQCPQPGPLVAKTLYFKTLLNTQCFRLFLGIGRENGLIVKRFPFPSHSPLGASALEQSPVVSSHSPLFLPLSFPPGSDLIVKMMVNDDLY